VRVVVVATTLLAAASLPLVAGTPGMLSGAHAGIAAALIAVLAALAHLRPFKLASKRTVDVATAPEVAGVLLLPGPWAALAVVTGAVVGEAVRQVRPLQQLFNGALALLRASVAIAVFAAVLRGGSHLLTEPVAALLAVLTLYLIGRLAVQVIGAVQLRRWDWGRLVRERPEVLVMEASLSVVGIVVAFTAAHHLWLLPALALPAAGADQTLRSHAARRASDERAAQLVSASPDLVLLLASDGTVRYANAAAEPVLGVAAAAVVGRSALELFTALPGTNTNTGEHPLQAWLHAVPGSQPPMTTLRLGVAGRDTDNRILEARVRLLYAASATDLELLLLARDVTEWVRVERLQAQTLRLEREARRAAEQTSQANDEILAMLSHELRTPLTGLIAASQLLQRRIGQDESLLQLVHLVERNAQAQAQLVNELLDVSRITTGKLQITWDPVELSEVVHEVVASYGGMAEEHGVQLSLEEANAASLIHGDYQRLRQVVTNLVTNAIKFTPSGGCVKLSLGVDGDQVRLQVADTGMGISPAFLPHVFDPFRQQDSSSTREQSGLGLGLAIVRRLVELHGGQVTVASPGEGQGTTFAVTLPQLAVGAVPVPREAPE
jgi:PAS domain S-box-containing protein